jgi:hypothetical protein
LWISWVEKKSVYTDEELCRRAASYETALNMDKFRIGSGKGFTELSDRVRTEVSGTMLDNSEQCYQTCLKKLKNKI